MKRNYLVKKLSYVHVPQVISVTKWRGGERHEVMRFIPHPYVIDGVPDGCFCLGKDSILLPIRKRGQKFVVRYTILMEKTL